MLTQERGKNHAWKMLINLTGYRTNTDAGGDRLIGVKSRTKDIF